MKKQFLSGFALLVALAAGSFAADTYKLDPNHSAVNFCVKHMVLSTVCGKFKAADATINLDETDITKSSWSGTIKTASISTDQDNRDEDLKSAGFFDVQKYPEITFKSTKIEKAKDGYVAVGNLTMKDVTKEIRVPFTPDRPRNAGRQEEDRDCCNSHLESPGLPHLVEQETGQRRAGCQRRSPNHPQRRSRTAKITALLNGGRPLRLPRCLVLCFINTVAIAAQGRISFMRPGRASRKER